MHEQIEGSSAYRSVMSIEVMSIQKCHENRTVMSIGEVISVEGS